MSTLLAQPRVPSSLRRCPPRISSNLEDDFATKSLAEAIDEKLLWPYMCPREPQILARFGILMLFLTYVIDIDSLTVLGGNTSTAREQD